MLLPRTERRGRRAPLLGIGRSRLSPNSRLSTRCADHEWGGTAPFGGDRAGINERIESVEARWNHVQSHRYVVDRVVRDDAAVTIELDRSGRSQRDVIGLNGGAVRV